MLGYSSMSITKLQLKTEKFCFCCWKSTQCNQTTIKEIGIALNAHLDNSDQGYTLKQLQHKQHKTEIETQTVIQLKSVNTSETKLVEV